MRVASALGAARHVVEVIDALDGEGDVLLALDEGEVSPRFADLGKVDDPAQLQAHAVHSSSLQLPEARRLAYSRASPLMIARGSGRSSPAAIAWRKAGSRRPCSRAEAAACT